MQGLLRFGVEQVLREIDPRVDPVWAAELRKIDLSGKQVDEAAVRRPTERWKMSEGVEKDR